jgi:hypothetical protein
MYPLTAASTSMMRKRVTQTPATPDDIARRHSAGKVGACHTRSPMRIRSTVAYEPARLPRVWHACFDSPSESRTYFLHLSPAPLDFCPATQAVDQQVLCCSVTRLKQVIEKDKLGCHARNVRALSGGAKEGMSRKHTLGMDMHSRLKPHHSKLLHPCRTR